MSPNSSRDWLRSPSKTSRLRCSSSRFAALLLLLVWAEFAGSSARLAARIDGDEISITAVDAETPDEVHRIRVRLLDVTRAAVEDLVDRRLDIRDPAERSRLYAARNVTIRLPGSHALETTLPGELVVASIGKVPIHAAAVEERQALRLYRLRGELYLQRRRNLDALIDRRLLQRHARVEGTTLEVLESRLARTGSVTNAELEEYVARERASGRRIDDPERVRPYLAFQKHYRRRASLLQALRAQVRIDIELQPPVSPSLPMETKGGVTLGSPDDRVLVVYTNYSCALCRATHLEIDRLLADKRQPRVVLKDFVLDPVAMEAAALVRCAASRGGAAAVRKLLLSRNPPASGTAWLGDEAMRSAAHSAGMTVPMLQECTRSPSIRAQIEHDTRSAKRLGFDDPPAFVVAGMPLSGMQSAELLRDALAGRYRPQLQPSPAQ